MRGIDFSKPVEKVTLRAGDVVDVWVRDGKTAGPWGTNPGTSPQDLGITVDSVTGLPKGRHLESYVLKDDVTVTYRPLATFIERPCSRGETPSR
jgi:hypothetical protein